MTSLPVLLALLAAAPGAPADDVRLAVVAGNNRGLDREQRLEFAEEDARRVLGVLTQLGGVAPENATLVLGGGPAQLLEALGAMLDRAQALAARTPVTLIVYVSAHADEDSLHLGGETLELALLRDLLDRAPARLRITIVDACRLPVQAGAKGGRPVAEVPVVVDRSSRVDGDVFIAAASPGELAQEWSELRGALFTHYLVAGLRGAADLDHNGRVTLGEAYTHAYRATLARAAAAGLVPQRPSFDMRVAGFGDWVFTRVGEGGAEITLAGPLSGRFWFTDPRSDVVAEVEKQAGEPLALSLPPGRYRVIRVAPDWVEAADVNLSFGGTRRIEAAMLVRVRAERALAKGGPGIELRPWTVVLGWGASSAVDGRATQQAAEAGAERAFGAWRARLLVGAGWSDTPAERATLHQTELRVPVALAWTFPVSFTRVGLGLEARPRLVWQRITRDVDTGGMGGPIPGERAFVFAAGPLASLALPLGDRFTLSLEAWAGLEWAPDQTGDVGRGTVAQLALRGGWKL